jgi:hypothetical protein
MFCAPELVFNGSDGVRSRFHVLRSQTRFRWCRGRRVPFSCFALPDTFSAVRRAAGPVFMFCAPRLVFGGTDEVHSHFHVLRSESRFRRFRDSFSAVPRASGPVFIFCVPVLIFGNTEGVSSRFHVLRCKTRFLRCGGRRLLFSCFALPDTFSAVSRASGPVFIFCVPVLVFGGAEGVGSCFHVLRSRAHFQQYRGRRVPFSCFSPPDTFLAVRKTSGPVFMFSRPDTFSAV